MEMHVVLLNHTENFVGVVEGFEHAKTVQYIERAPTHERPDPVVKKGL